MELICVDNGSIDGTPEIIRSYGVAVRLIEEPKRGPAAARNAGIRAASHPIAAFTDSDCMVDPGWLGAITGPIEAGDADAVGGRILARPEAGPLEMFGELVHDHAKAIEYCRPPYLIAMNLAARVDPPRSIHCFDEPWIRLKDVDLTFRLLEAGARIRYEPSAIVRHYTITVTRCPSSLGRASCTATTAASSYARIAISSRGTGAKLTAHGRKSSRLASQALAGRFILVRLQVQQKRR